MPSSYTLAQLPIGTPAVIQSVATSRSGLTRLRELGLVPGTSVSVVRRALLGEPIEVRVRGSRLAMRKRDAEDIQVVVEEAAAVTKNSH